MRIQRPSQGARLQRPPVHRISVIQAAVLGVGWLLLRQYEPVVADSLVLGGMTAVIPQAYFAFRLFARRGAGAAQQIARAGYAGEIGKFVLAVTGFALIFAFVRPLAGWAVFAGYGAMLMIQLVGAWWLLRRPVTSTGSG